MTASAILGATVTISLFLFGVIFALGKLFQKVSDIDNKLGCVNLLDAKVDNHEGRLIGIETHLRLRRATDHQIAAEEGG